MPLGKLLTKTVRCSTLTIATRLLRHIIIVPWQGTFLSYALNGVPLDPISSGTFDLGPANGAGPASISPDLRGVLTSLLAEDAAQLG